MVLEVGDKVKYKLKNVVSNGYYLSVSFEGTIMNFDRDNRTLIAVKITRGFAEYNTTTYMPGSIITIYHHNVHVLKPKFEVWW